VKASSRAPTPFLSPPDDEPCSFIDIGANLLDPMFLGQYNGKQKHECDLDALLERAAEQVPT
jgi:TatD DNase family protein